MTARVMVSKIRLPDVEAIALEVGKVLYVEGERIVSQAKNLVPVDTGNLRASIRAELPRQELDRVIVELVAGGTQAPYALYVHEGTRPRFLTGGKRPPLDALQRWVEHKGFHKKRVAGTGPRRQRARRGVRSTAGL